MANINENARSSASQCNQIAAWLRAGHTITALQALNLFGCMRLASRICDLRERGMDIKKQRVQLPSGKYVCEYSLKSDPSKENPPEHYRKVKEIHTDAILLFRCGDFYETYCDDAQTCADVLGLSITKPESKSSYRIVGFPRYALDTYLPKLIRAGKRVAICDQDINY